MKELVTKFKGSVSNDTLPIYKTIKCHVHSVENPNLSNRMVFALNATTAVSGRVSGIACLYVGTPDFSVDSGITTRTTESVATETYVGSGEFDVLVSDKYKITKFSSNTSMDVCIEDFEYCLELTSELSIQFNNFAYGSFEKLGRLIKLTSIGFRNTDINGDISVLAANQVLFGRTSGTITFITSRQTRLNGTLLSNNKTYTIRFGSSMVNPTAEETTQGYQIVAPA